MWGDSIGDVDPPTDEVGNALFGSSNLWVDTNEYKGDELAALFLETADAQEEFIQELHRIRRRYDESAIGKIFEPVSDAIDMMARILDRRADSFRHYADLIRTNSVFIQDSHAYDMRIYYITKVQWEAYKEASKSIFTEEFWLGPTSVEEFVAPAAVAIRRNQSQIAEAMDRKYAEAVATAPRLPEDDRSILSSVHTHGVRNRSSASPLISDHELVGQSSFEPNSSVMKSSDAPVRTVGSGPSSGSGLTDFQVPAGVDTANTDGVVPSVSSVPSGDVPGSGGGVLPGQSVPVAPNQSGGVPVEGGIVGDAATELMGSGDVPSLVSSPVSFSASGGVGNAAAPVSGLGSGVAPGVSGVTAPAPVGGEPRALWNSPGSVGSSGGGAQSPIVQSPTAGGVPGIAPGGVAPGGVNAAAQSKPVVGVPGVGVDAAKQEQVAAVAARPGQAFQQRYGVLDSSEEPNLVAALGALRLLARQSLDALGEARVQMFGVNHAFMVIEHGLKEPLFLWNSTGLAGGIGYLHRGLKIDSSAENLYQGGNKYRLPAWCGASVDPVAPLLVAYQTIVADAVSHNEPEPRLAHLVTTRAATPHPETVRAITQAGAVLRVDAPDAGKMEAVVLPDWLTHRVYQLDPQLSWLLNVKISREDAMAFGLALTQEAIDLSKGFGETHNEAQAVIDALTQKLPAPWAALKAHYGDDGAVSGGRLHAALVNMVDHDPEADQTEEERAIALFADDTLRDIMKQTNPIYQHSLAWRQAVVDALALHLGRFDNPTEKPGHILADLCYEYHHAINSREQLDSHLTTLEPYRNT